MKEEKKPWEGKKWIEITNALNEYAKEYSQSLDENYKGRGLGFIIAVGALWGALKTDWNDKQEYCPQCKNEFVACCCLEDGND